MIHRALLQYDAPTPRSINPLVFVGEVGLPVFATKFVFHAFESNFFCGSATDMFCSLHMTWLFTTRKTLFQTVLGGAFWFERPVCLKEISREIIGLNES